MDVLAAMPDGIGDLTFLSPNWIDAARDVLDAQVAKPEWATPVSCDRRDGYDASWTRYDRLDIYGSPRQ